MQTKEQLMSDIALLIKAHDQEKSQDRLIRQEEKEIKHLILKQVKKKTMLMLLLPSLVMILISLFIYHSTSLMMIGLILLIVWFVKNKNIRPENKSITKSKGYKKAEKELKDQPDIQQHQHNIQRHQHTLTDIHHTVAASKAQQRIPKHLQYGQKERHIALEQPMKMPQKLLKMQVQQQLMRIKQEKILKNRY